MHVSESSGPDSMGHGGHVPPLLQMAGQGGTVSRRTAKQETDQTVLTMTKALTKTTSCAFRAKKKWRARPTIFAGALCQAADPQVQIRSGAT